jgi:type VI secretion system protein ImpB
LFSTDQVARQVDPIKKLLELRTKLGDLRGKLQGNDKLEEILQATLSDEEKLNKLKEELGSEESSEGDAGDEGGNDG